MEDPGGPVDDILPTVNLTNNSQLDYMVDNTGKNKFYLPVSTAVRGQQHDLQRKYCGHLKWHLNKQNETSVSLCCVVLCCVRVQLCIFSWTLVEQVSLGAAPQFIVYQKRAVLAVLPLRQHLGLTKLKVSHIFIKVCNITYQSHSTCHIGSSVVDVPLLSFSTLSTAVYWAWCHAPCSWGSTTSWRWW